MLRYSLYHHSPQAMRNTLYYRPLQRLDSPTDRKNPLVQSLLSGQILPVTGTFFPQTCLQKSRFFQPLEESSRSKPAQRPKTSSQWRNHPAYRPLCVLILTSTGGIRTQKAIDLTVRMDFHGTRMRSCGVCRRGSGGPSRWADRYSLRCACDTEAGIVANQNEKNCAEHTRGTTPWALRPSPPAHHPPPATRLREAKTFPNHIAARVAP